MRNKANATKNKKHDVTVGVSRTDGNWFVGYFEASWGFYKFQAKIFDTDSKFGINQGRISKLGISRVNRLTGWKTLVVNYDCGWDIKPNSKKDNTAYSSICAFLEQFKKTDD
jgi:hypothetical protein